MVRIGKEQLEKLQKRYPTDASIAALYGITRQAVQKLRVKYGISVKLNTKTDRNREIIRLRESGMTVSRIARKFDLSETQIYRILSSVTYNV